ncbi:hypothetical protein F443_11947 [Phytophthora nicotianae P1569]|uniref:Uncharacterized protein n=1 Tax=Phytophthora nicotianae P1569 TaxID=1317065 RepID=V9EY68_PHYNI|nr:hypothetical protein F443_11947 [Phytophthora nicotianae P1569]
MPTVRYIKVFTRAGFVSGRIDVFRCLLSNHPREATEAAMDRAACGGHLEMIQWLHVNRSEEKAMDYEAANGHVDVSSLGRREPPEIILGKSSKVPGIFIESIKIPEASYSVLSLVPCSGPVFA